MELDTLDAPIIKYVEFDNSYPNNIDLLSGIRPFYSNSENTLLLANVLVKYDKLEYVYTPGVVNFNLSIF